MNPGHRRGVLGETRAVSFLESLGWRILKKNFRTSRGEVDIIGDDGAEVVFVEVKAWAAFNRDSLEFAVDARKQRRIIETAKRFLAVHPQYRDRMVRFDVIFVEAETGKIEHLRSAFET